MPLQAADLSRFQLPGLLDIVDGPGNLPRLEIHTPLCTANITLHGAHLTHYAPAGKSPVIFTSEHSFYAPDKAIRGGVPVIFPWFGPHGTRRDLPMHGFARTSEWELETTLALPDQTVQAVFRLIPTETTHALWPHDFVLRMRFTLGRELGMALEVENWSGAAFTCEEALHTYLMVRDVRQISITGLNGTEYIDKADGMLRKREEQPAITITGETDRVYVNTEARCVLDDAAAARKISVAKEGSQTTVIWNPWEAKAKALADFGDDEWPKMVCIETANAGENAITLQHGEAHILRAIISVE